MAGAFGELTLTETELERTLERFALCQLESLPTSRYLLPPRLLLDIGAKQLAGYGGSLDTATTDITHYLTAGSGVLVLCGGAVRCRNMQEFCSGGTSRRRWRWTEALSRRRDRC